VAYVERLCFDRLDRIGAPTYGPLSLTGGGARSQLRADVLERDVRLPEHAEPAFGMAVLAASRGHRLADAAASMVRVNDVIKPRPGRAERFRAPYLKLVDELEQRGWLDEDLARHARARASA
jgi:sugar (pentulose or hexulose) kinase